MEEEKVVNFHFEVEFEEQKAAAEGTSSQTSDLDKAELDKLVLDSKSENTRKCTNWGFSKLRTWLEKRNIPIDFKTVEADKLNDILRKFYAEVRSAKNEMFTPSSMTGIRAAINRTLLAPPYSRNMNIIADREFSTANDMFSARCKIYYKTNNKKPKHKDPIEQADMNRLQIYFSNCFDDPSKLQECVWFNLCLHFGRRGREGWRELQKEHFTVMTDAKGNRYVTMVLTESTKNNPGGYK
ncbi:uncharacterized protein [Clytia hemisphaerica]|uniref:uncharacterized protein n=1 Tax=Clytia hemisphaerica TaxID=252671 RepID=UPI0034D471B6